MTIDIHYNIDKVFLYDELQGFFLRGGSGWYVTEVIKTDFSLLRNKIMLINVMNLYMNVVEL